MLDGPAEYRLGKNRFLLFLCFLNQRTLKRTLHIVSVEEVFHKNQRR